jgi:hypothetical protein
MTCDCKAADTNTDERHSLKKAQFVMFATSSTPDLESNRPHVWWILETLLYVVKQAEPEACRLNLLVPRLMKFVCYLFLPMRFQGMMFRQTCISTPLKH